MLPYRSLLFALGTFCGVGTLRAQVLQVQAGEWVRFRTLSGPRVIQGTVLHMRADTLILSPQGAAPALGQQLTIPLAIVEGLEVRRGHRSGWRWGTEIGSFTGLVAASTIFAAQMDDCIGGECAKSVRWLPYGAAGALAGAAVGGLVGALFHHDIWEGVPITPARPQVVMVHDRVTVSLSLRFRR